MRAPRSTSRVLALLLGCAGAGAGGQARAEPVRLRVAVAEGTGPLPGDLALDLSLQNTAGRPVALPLATCASLGWTSFVTLQIKVPGGRVYRFYASGRADLADEHEHTPLVLAPGQLVRQRVPFLEAVQHNPVGDADAGLSRALGRLSSVEISASIAGGSAAPAVSYRFALPQVSAASAAGGCAQNVSTGGGPVCSLLADGTPYCWGPNAPGLDLDAGDSEVATPQPVGLLRRSALDAGAFGSGLCALGVRGEVFCTHAEAGGTPVRVAGLMDAVRLHLGRSEQCASGRDGSIACWGGATEGQASSSGMRPGAAPVPGLSRDTAELVFGLRHTCARKLDGSLLCWGDNRVGQLGTGDALSRRHPSPVRLAGPVDSVALGHTHSCAVLRDGSVQCWGKSEYGALGRGPEPKSHQSLLPVRVEGLGPAARVFAGYDKTAVKARDGGLYYFGGGVLLDGAFGRLSTFRPLHLVSLGNDVVEVVFGGRHACARKQDGAVFCWGEERALGAPQNRPPALAQPVRVSGLPADVKALAAGDGFTCALSGRGAVSCWGEGAAGQLGQGKKASSLSPVRVALPCN